MAVVGSLLPFVGFAVGKALLASLRIPGNLAPTGFDDLASLDQPVQGCLRKSPVPGM